VHVQADAIATSGNNTANARSFGKVISMRLRRLLFVASVQLIFILGGAARPAAAPSVPLLIGPANGASVTVPFKISWSSTLNPASIDGGYNWQVSRSSTFSPLVLADSTNPATTEDAVSGLTNGTYFWRVQAVDNTGVSAWSAARSFVVTGAGAGSLAAPVLAPTRGYSTFHPWEAIHFDWSAVPNAVTYRLEVSNDPNFPVGPLQAGTTTFWNDNIPTNSDGYIHTMIGNWYARVFAVDADNPQTGVRGLPSNVIQFSCFYNNPIGPPPQLQSPLGDPTLTLPVTLNWAHVPNPQPMGYLWEVARDPGFTDIEAFNNQYTEPTAVMLSLTSGPKYWRVLSQHGLSSPTTNANTDWSATGRFTISSAPATPVSIAPLGNTQMVMYSGASGMVAVQLTAGVPAAGATIQLASSHPSVAPVPASLAIQGTHAWTQFPFTVGQVTSPTVVTLSATVNGVTASSQFTLRPPTLNDVTLQPQVRATGGATISGWVDLEGGGLAGPAGLSVNLSTDSPSASVPASVTIPAGVSGTGFSINTSPVTTTTVATITASALGVTQTWKITLTPGPAPTSLLVRPMSTTNGSQGVVTAAAGSGQDEIIQVKSSDPAHAAVPGTVTVFAGSGVGFFDIATTPVSAPTAVTISVSGGGVTLSHPLTLYPTLPALSALTVSPTTVVAGNSATGTVTLAGPAPPNGVAINLASNQPLSASVPLSVTVPGGATSANFTVSTFPRFGTTVQLSAAMDGTFQFAAISVTEGTPAASLSAISVSPSSVTGGSSSTGTVTLSGPAPSGGAVVSLSENSTATSVPASVTVPAGSPSATFTVTTTSVSVATTSTISAAWGSVTQTAALTVNPPAPPPPPAPAAPALVSPADAAIGVAQPATLDWSDVSGATSYEVQVDDTSTISAPLVANPTTTASQATLATGLPAQTLWWRVRARNSAGVFGPFSAARRFTPQGSATTAATLTVTASGRSGERITSSPAGINVNVGSSGSASFNTGTSTTLSVSNGRDAIWSGACSSGGNKQKTCTFTLSGNASVNANVQ
jgi:hypothetical protein